MNNIDRIYKIITSSVIGVLCIITIYLTFSVNKVEMGLTDVNVIESIEGVAITSINIDKVSKRDWMVGFPKHSNHYHECNCMVIDDSLDGNFENTFDYVYPRFKVFNKNIDTLTTKFFIGVMDAYNLDKTPYHRQMYTGQILLESGAKQHYSDGRLVVSSGNAIGFCQILPSTCQWLLETYADSSDVTMMKLLGATSFSFVFDKTISKSKRVSMSKVWLSNVSNNIIMWGFLTKHSLDDKGSVDVQLVSYNMGDGGCRTYMNSGGKCYNHPYIKGILSKLNYADNHD